MADYYKLALEQHEKWQGKLSTELKMPLETKDDLSIAYTPGVAKPCLEIQKNPEDVYKYTWKGNVVAVVSDGTAVLGLGDIGPQAAMPVMEGKCVLFKHFGGVNAVPLCIDTKDTEEIIRFVKQVAPTFGGINLEDISSPRCVEIERRLIEELDIPVFHDDQHGTAIVVTAGLINALKLVGKKPEDLKVVVSGTGAAGSSIIRMIRDFGVPTVYAFDSRGIIRSSACEGYNFVKKEIAQRTNPQDEALTLAQAMMGADVFIGVSGPGVLTKEMVASMNQDAILFAMANPEPEIAYADAVAAGARVVGTGRSDFPNQVNNVLAFPGLFRGALSVRARKITDEMKFAAAQGLASLIAPEELTEEYVIPKPFDPRVAKTVAQAVAQKAVEQGLNRIPLEEN
ncbi:NADP-dependent malic enzyme [Clostridiaceae bacterium JG1575]|nr:NADP-dependent malic enzyme [Clostridiaceae bacterium JG1575]